jgi:DnaK suppressor protein
MADKTRYSDADLQEFKEVINEKLDVAKVELKSYQDQIKSSDDIDADSRYTGLEDGTGTVEKEHLSNMAARQLKFIQGLESALQRIANKTYGVCRQTGKLIEKKRLLAVPHATLSMEAKLTDNK